MSVHAVKISVSSSQESNPSTQPDPGPPDWLPNLLKDRVDRNVFNDLTEELPEQASSPSKRNTSTDGTGAEFIGMRYRVSKVDSKKTVLNRFENKVVTDAEWYRIEHHECDHDEENPTGCGSWTVEREKGNVPEGV